MLKANFVPESWDGEEPEFTAIPEITMSPKEHVKIIIQNYPI